MDNSNPNSSGNPPGGEGNQPNKDGIIQGMEVRHAPVSARVPERMARGVLSTGVLVLDGPYEFVLDFMQGLSRPFQVAARVVLTPAVMEQLCAALRDNLQKYEARFGPPAPLPKPPSDRRPTLQEIYDEFKLPDEQLSGTYANAVMIGHSPSEFFFDFITNFFPTSAVSNRVFLSAQQIPRTLEAFGAAFARWQQRMVAARQAQFQQMPQVNLQQFPIQGSPQQFAPPPQNPPGPQQQNPPDAPQQPQDPQQPPQS